MPEFPKSSKFHPNHLFVKKPSYQSWPIRTRYLRWALMLGDWEDDPTRILLSSPGDRLGDPEEDRELAMSTSARGWVTFNVEAEAAPDVMSRRRFRLYPCNEGTERSHVATPETPSRGPQLGSVTAKGS
jgi:hypothetical protein